MLPDTVCSLVRGLHSGRTNQRVLRDACTELTLKEGRKDYICSSRLLGLIRWYDRFRSDQRIQQIKAILDKVRYTNDILLPHELLHGASAIHKQSSILVPHTLQSRALEDHVAFDPNCRHKRWARGAPVRRP